MKKGKINEGKTKDMVISQRENLGQAYLADGNHRHQQVKQLKYQGALMTILLH